MRYRKSFKAQATGKAPKEEKVIVIPDRDKNGIRIPSIAPKEKTKEEKELEEKRHDWEKKYTYWLRRKNKFADKLENAGRDKNKSTRYQELRDEVQQYWQLLHDSKPPYSPL